ncbi:MAG: hypothetical protein WD066_17260, partial [Planctomycetaceae bacterium]
RLPTADCRLPTAMRNLCLTLARMCLAGWVGGAVLFVVTSVREQVAPDFDQATRAALALVRFPSYYLFGFALIAAALPLAFAGMPSDRFGRRRWLCCGSIAAALIVMTIDYASVYLPLAEMMKQPPGLRPATFRAYHAASVYINIVHVGFGFAAAGIACWPVPIRGESL